MSKQKQIDLSKSMILTDDINNNQEVLDILDKQDKMTSFLITADDRFNKLKEKGFPSELIFAIRENWRELLLGLDKTLFRRNGNEDVNVALDDFHALQFKKERIEKEGEIAIKEADYFPSEEQEVNIISLEILSEISELLEKREIAEDKKNIDKKIQELEERYKNFLERVYGTAKPKKIEKLLKEKYAKRAINREKVAENIIMLANNEKVSKLAEKVKELEYLVEVAETVNEVLNQTGATWTQKLNAEECLINLEQTVKRKNGREQLAESYKRLENSLNIEENKNELKKKISETVLKMEQEINEARIKGEGESQLTRYFGERVDGSTYTKQVKEKLKKVIAEYQKAKTAFERILEDMENENKNDKEVMMKMEGIIRKLENVNLEKTYLKEFYQAIEELDEIIDSHPADVSKQKQLEMKKVLMIEEGEKNTVEFQENSELIEFVNKLVDNEYDDTVETLPKGVKNIPSKEKAKESLIKQITSEQFKVISKMEKPEFKIECLDTTVRENLDKMDEYKAVANQKISRVANDRVEKAFERADKRDSKFEKKFKVGIGEGAKEPPILEGEDINLTLGERGKWFAEKYHKIGVFGANFKRMINFVAKSFKNKKLVNDFWSEGGTMTLINEEPECEGCVACARWYSAHLQFFIGTYKTDKTDSSHARARFRPSVMADVLD